MKVKDLVEILSKFPSEAEVIIHKDVDEYGYGHIEKIVPGIFELTKYGNDFYPYQGIMLNAAQVRSVCLEAEKHKKPEHKELDNPPPKKH